MSKIGRKSIQIPEGVTFKADDKQVVATGTLGTLNCKIPDQIKIEINDNQIFVTRKADDKLSRSLHGTVRALIANSLEGVSKGFEKQLEIVGIGYRASLEGDKLTLKVGFSHEVEKIIPKELSAEVKKNIISIKGIDKQMVGQTAAEIRAIKKPEPYKGKGIRYIDEKIIRKVGKAVKSAGTGA